MRVDVPCPKYVWDPLEQEYIPCTGTVTAECTTDPSWGADADGNRGTYMDFADPVSQTCSCNLNEDDCIRLAELALEEYDTWKDDRDEYDGYSDRD